MKSILPFLLALACVACAPKENHAPVAKHVVFIGIDGWAAEAVGIGHQLGLQIPEDWRGRPFPEIYK